ncbi:MAG: threonine/serine exporter [Erysipelotrichaceae bacterium]|nr:threonine/serine exporter [Erysipelotrichaceae bacterium]MBQ9987631.1 threonine/serine exporter family protein [Erysipelotrichales bacterium]MBR3693790.1 threonine/serine exporter family protein [Erysipelotrichales bacterium]
MIVSMISAFFATAGFAVMFNIRGKKILYAALGGAVGACINYYCLHTLQLNSFMALFYASVGLSLYSEYMARRTHTPVTVFAVCALICFVPGGTMYYTMLAIVNQNNVEALGLLVETLASAGALALGIILVSTLTRLYTRIQKRKELHHGQ